MYLLLVFTYQWIVLHISPLVPFLAFINISVKVSSLANPGAERKRIGSSPHISRNIFQKLLNRLAIVVMYQFEHASHDNHQMFFFLNLLFYFILLHVCNWHQ